MSPTIIQTTPIQRLEEILGEVPDTILPSVVMQAFELDPRELEARTLAYSVRQGVDVTDLIEKGRIRTEHVDRLLSEEVDLSQGYAAFLRGLISTRTTLPASTVNIMKRVISKQNDGLIPEVLPPEIEEDAPGEEEDSEFDVTIDIDDQGAVMDIRGRSILASENILPVGEKEGKKAVEVKRDLDYLARVGSTMNRILAAQEMARDILSPQRARTTEEYFEKNSFSPDFLPAKKYASAEDLAETIYREVKDKITWRDFHRMIRERSEDPLYQDHWKISLLYLRGKSAAILERAGITKITLVTLENMYLSVPKTVRKGFFTKSNRGKQENIQRWGENYLERLVVGQMVEKVEDYRSKQTRWIKGKKVIIFSNEKITKTVLQEDSGIDRELPRDAYDAVSLLPPPWLYGIHYATLAFAQHARKHFHDMAGIDINPRQLPAPQKVEVVTHKLSWDYIPLERRVAPENYPGFTQEQIKDLFEYFSVEAVQRALEEIKLHRLVEVPVLGSSEEKRHDLRGYGYYLIRCGREGQVTITYTQEKTFEVIRGVLTVEGVKEEFIQNDIPRILVFLEKEGGLKLKMGNRYIAGEMQRSFRFATEKAYHSLNTAKDGKTL